MTADWTKKDLESLESVRVERDDALKANGELALLWAETEEDKNEAVIALEMIKEHSCLYCKYEGCDRYEEIATEALAKLEKKHDSDTD